ncbi:MAG: hypothetical protein AMXMBFR4_29260 [Candidatus Hydrogenedentota bacterium]
MSLSFGFLEEFVVTQLETLSLTPDSTSWMQAYNFACALVALILGGVQWFIWGYLLGKLLHKRHSCESVSQDYRKI